MSEAAADDPPAPRAVPIEPEPGAAEWPAGSTSRRGRWMASAGLLILAGAYDWEYLASEYLPYFLLLGFSEAWLSGMLITMFIKT